MGDDNTVPDADDTSPPFQQLADSYEAGLEASGEAGEEFNDGGGSSEDPAFFHLKNAQVDAGVSWQPRSDPSGMYWRGRISSVDGFALAGTGEQE